MKKLTPVLPAILLLLTSTYDHLNAQVTKATSSYNSGSNIVIINKASARISNLYTLDSAKAPHMVSFDLELGSSTDAKIILNSLFNAIGANQAMPLTIKKMTYQGTVIEERTYNTAMVEEIGLPDLTTGSKDAATVRVTLGSPEVVLRSDLNEPGPAMSKQIRNEALTNNFKMVLGSLPTTRVYSISNIRINRQATGGFLNFSVVLARADSKSWKDWFFQGAGGGQRLKGTIMLMDASMQNAVVTLEIPEVEIMSVSEIDNNLENTPRTTVGLRTRKVDLTK